jgi:lipopolysaccharide exporter
MSDRSQTDRMAVRGMAWSVFATGGGRVISLASVVVLARLLVPAEFGLVAFALVFIAYVEAIGDLGTGAALVRWPARWPQVAQVAFAINLAMGAVWFALTLVAAPSVAEFFGNPDGVPVLRALAWTFPLKALGNTHDALMQRELRFQARAVPELSLLTAKAAVAIPLAAAGLGVWSLVWGQLIGQALWTALLWVMVPWRPVRAMPPLDIVKSVFSYGRGIVAVNLLAVVVHHVDLVVVGRIFGVAVLGFYQMADKLPDVAVTLLSRATSKVLFPVFSRLHAGGDALRETYTVSLRYLSLLTTPAAVALVLLAEPIVLTVFGAQWLPSVPILRALAAYAGVRALSASAGDVLKAIGRPGLLAFLAAIRAVVLVPALLLASAQGPAAVAFMLGAITALSTILTIAVVCSLSDVSWGSVVEALRPSMGVAAVLSVALGLVMHVTAPLSPSVQLALASVAGLGAYLAAVRLLSPTIWRDARDVIGERVARWRRPAGVMVEAQSP